MFRSASNLLTNRLQQLIVFRKELKEISGKLIPGWYFMQYPYAIRIGTPVPASVRKDFKKKMYKKGSLKGLIVRMYLLPFSLVHIKNDNKHSQTTSYTLAIRSRLGHLILFDTVQDKVLIKYLESEQAARIAEYATLKPGYLPLTEIEYDGDSTILSPLIRGTILENTRPEIMHERFRYVLTFFLERIHSTMADGNYFSADEARDFIDRNTIDYFPAELKQQIAGRREQIKRILTSCPVIFSHGDLTSKNIIVSEDKTVVIDFEYCGWIHAFYDVIYIPMHWFISGKSSSFLDEMCNGSLYHEYKAIFRTYMPDGPVHVMDLIYAFILCQADRERLYPATKLENVTRLAGSGRILTEF